MNRPSARTALALFALLYLADYALTLAGTARPGFHELNPLAQTWNAGDHLRPLLLKLGVLGLVAMAQKVMGEARGFHWWIRALVAVFALVDTFGVLSLAR